MPSGVWAPEEYERLPRFDAPTGEQPPGVFLCHQQDGLLCAGWVGCHDMDESLGLRLAALDGALDEAAVQAVLDYETEVPLWESGRAAADHGLRDVAAPGDDARRAIRRLGPKVAAPHHDPSKGGICVR